MSATAKAALLGRLEALELRLKLLEARVRSAKQAAQPKSARTVVRRGRRRCPGCTLELPKGARGETCVWCGFRFDAVEGLSPRRRRASAR